MIDMEEVTIQEKNCNSWSLTIDTTVSAEASYGYKFYNVVTGKPDYYNEITLEEGSDTTTVELHADDDGVYMLEVNKKVEEEDDVYMYALMLCLCRITECKEQLLQEVLCGTIGINTRHDCDKQGADIMAYNIKLQEMMMIYYELVKYVERYSKTVEELGDEDRDVLVIRIKDLVEKLNAISRFCTSCKERVIVPISKPCVNCK